MEGVYTHNSRNRAEPPTRELGSSHSDRREYERRKSSASWFSLSFADWPLACLARRLTQKSQEPSGRDVQLVFMLLSVQPGLEVPALPGLQNLSARDYVGQVRNRGH
jgi:hypothetical protein